MDTVAGGREGGGRRELGSVASLDKKEGGGT